MDTHAIFPLMPSRDLTATKDFYTCNGWMVEMEGEAFLQLAFAPKPDIKLGFFRPIPDHPVAFFRAEQVENVVISIVVDDPDSALHAARANGHDLAVEMRREPWGQRHFAITDPNGLIIDFNVMEGAAAGQAAQ
jgi:catechol 2,3-dioxygenase-like lactoylglutathione lyase family enzyme